MNEMRLQGDSCSLHLLHYFIDFYPIFMIISIFFFRFDFHGSKISDKNNIDRLLKKTLFKYYFIIFFLSEAILATQITVGNATTKFKHNFPFLNFQPHTN